MFHVLVPVFRPNEIGYVRENKLERFYLYLHRIEICIDWWTRTDRSSWWLLRNFLFHGNFGATWWFSILAWIWSLLLKKYFYSITNETLLKNLCDGRTFSRIERKHSRNQIGQFSGIIVGHFWWFATEYFCCQWVYISRILLVFELASLPLNLPRIESMFLGHHFKCATSKGPYIGFFSIWGISKQFWAHIIRRANNCGGQVLRRIKNTCNSKVTKLYNMWWSQKYILSFQITMKNVFWMQVLKNILINKGRYKVKCFRNKIMVPVVPCIFEQAIQRDFVRLENLVSDGDSDSDHRLHKMPSQSSSCHRYCQMSHDTRQC